MLDHNHHGWEILIGLLVTISFILIIVIARVNIPDEWLLTLYFTDGLICLVIGWDFVHRLWDNPEKVRFWVLHGYEIFTLIPVALVYPVFEFTLVVAFLRLLRMIRVGLILTDTARFLRLTFNSPNRNQS